jgi:transcriptional regulator with XRE-family HTH domain
MRHPVYPFRLVLKELRHDAGLTVLAAAEATEYGNYERWESGETRVGAQHLRSIADAFGVTDERWLLLYAWLLDRLVPKPGKGAVDLAQVNLRRILRDLPKEAVDLGPHKHLVVESGRHLDVALLCLIARYRRRERVLLMPVGRSPLPDRQLGESVLRTTYAGDLADALRYLARRLFTWAQRGLISGDEMGSALVANLAPMLMSPEAFEALADEWEGPFAGNGRRFADLLRVQQRTLAAIMEGASGEPPTAEAVTRLAIDVAAGRLDRVYEMVVSAARNDKLPEIDPALTDEPAPMYEGVTMRWEQLARHELAEDLERVGVEGLFDVLELVAETSSTS